MISWRFEGKWVWVGKLRLKILTSHCMDQQKFSIHQSVSDIIQIQRNPIWQLINCWVPRQSKIKACELVTKTGTTMQGYMIMFLTKGLNMQIETGTITIYGLQMMMMLTCLHSIDPWHVQVLVVTWDLRHNLPSNASVCGFVIKLFFFVLVGAIERSGGVLSRTL